MQQRLIVQKRFVSDSSPDDLPASVNHKCSVLHELRLVIRLWLIHAPLRGNGIVDIRQNRKMKLSILLVLLRSVVRSIRADRNDVGIQFSEVMLVLVQCK